MQNLESLPDSTLSHVLSFLLSKELLALRSVGNRWLSTFFSSDGHENEQAEFLWRQALARDFKFTPVHFRCGSSDPLHHLRTLRIKTSEDDDDEEEDEDNENELGTSIFGYTARDSIYVASNAFESWRYWSKVSRIFFQGTDKSDTEYVNGPCESTEKLVTCSMPLVWYIQVFKKIYIYLCSYSINFNSCGVV